MIPSFAVYLFDVDRTLVDSALDICAAIQDTLVTYGRSDVTDAALRRYIGVHLLDTFLDLGCDPSQIDPMMVHYRRVYLARKHAGTRVFPGIAEMLSRLDGKKSTATTKGTPTTRAVLEQFELIRHFHHVQGTDGFPAKPEPDVILRSIEALGTVAEECLLVGDSAADMEAGQRAGVRTCAVRWGYGDVEEMAKWSPDYWIAEPAELLSHAQ